MEEGNSLLIDLTAKANPPQIEYKWTNPDRLSVPEAGDALPGTRDGRRNSAMLWRHSNFSVLIHCSTAPDNEGVSRAQNVKNVMPIIVEVFDMSKQMVHPKILGRQRQQNGTRECYL